MISPSSSELALLPAVLSRRELGWPEGSVVDSFQPVVRQHSETQFRFADLDPRRKKDRR